MAKAAKSESAPDFEKALAELEAIVSTLEKGDLSLDAALHSARSWASRHPGRARTSGRSDTSSGT